MNQDRIDEKRVEAIGRAYNWARGRMGWGHISGADLTAVAQDWAEALPSGISVADLKFAFGRVIKRNVDAGDKSRFPMVDEVVAVLTRPSVQKGCDYCDNGHILVVWERFGRNGSFRQSVVTKCRCQAGLPIGKRTEESVRDWIARYLGHVENVSHGVFFDEIGEVWCQQKRGEMPPRLMFEAERLGYVS